MSTASEASKNFPSTNFDLKYLDDLKLLNLRIVRSLLFYRNLNPARVFAGIYPGNNLFSIINLFVFSGDNMA